jgi:hypothetical protein
MVAGGYHVAAEAEAIALALEQLRPDSERPLIVRAVNRLNANDTAGAIEVLRHQALKKNPHSPMAKALLGLVLHVDGRSAERDQLLGEVVAAGDDAFAVALARRVLDA